MANGRLAREITPVGISQRKGDPIIVDRDEHPRPETTIEQLAKLPTPFRNGGTVTAGNASGVNDGAAALIIASEAAARKHGLDSRSPAFSAAQRRRVPPRIMGIGPIAATQRLCARLGSRPRISVSSNSTKPLRLRASRPCARCGIPEDAEYVNPNGGAIALGHPLGMSGARITGYRCA